MMRILPILALGAMALASPAAAEHILHLNVPYATRGACEADVAAFSADDRESLLDRFPNLFSSNGEVASFLTRAFPCERNAADGNWYIHDDRREILASDWFTRRL